MEVAVVIPQEGFACHLNYAADFQFSELSIQRDLDSSQHCPVGNKTRIAGCHSKGTNQFLEQETFVEYISDLHTDDPSSIGQAKAHDGIDKKKIVAVLHLVDAAFPPLFLVIMTRRIKARPQ